MKIGALSKQTNCKIETIRYYERIGLLSTPDRTENGYRVYLDADFRRLVFIRRSRELGFTIEEIRMLLGLVDGGDYLCSDIRKLTLAHIKSIKKKIVDLKKLEKTLTKISAQCTATAVPDCPIIDSLFEPKTMVSRQASKT